MLAWNRSIYCITIFKGLIITHSNRVGSFKILYQVWWVFFCSSAIVWHWDRVEVLSAYELFLTRYRAQVVWVPYLLHIFLNIHHVFLVVLLLHILRCQANDVMPWRVFISLFGSRITPRDPNLNTCLALGLDAGLRLDI